ncbi:MAG: rhomboid family intramembrane serine protease [Planctomycetota bacterium]
MIPLRDSIPAQRRPVVTVAMIAICAAVFLLQLADPEGGLIERYGMVPARVLGGEPPARVFGLGAHRLGHAAVPEWLTLFTCTFLHGGWLHFAGNMLFLWIFGDNVEDRLGRLGFAVFYVACGLAASATHLWIAPDSGVPTIGASGAIAGVMGAYMVLYPHSRVQMLWFWGFFVDVIVLPAPFFLGYWFVLQLLPGVMTLGETGRGGVAFWAHIGGFVVGVLTALALRLLGRLRPEPPSVVLTRQRFGRRSPRAPW